MNRAAIACACCGEDDESYENEVAPDSYEDGILSSIRFGTGTIRDGGDDFYWNVSGITRSSDGFDIQTDVGALRFVMSASPERRDADITFITKPHEDPPRMNDVYHELQIDGVLTLSAEAAKQFGQPTVKATLLLQGTGNACLEIDSYQRWLFRAITDRPILWGVGKLVPPGTNDPKR